MTIVADRLARSFAVGRRRTRRVVDAVQGLSFVVEPGERVAFIGPNGAGKSTSIKMLTGILHPTAGDASVLDLCPWRERRTLAREIGTLFGQRSQLWNELTPRQSYRMLGAIFGLDDRRLAQRTAELGDLLDAEDLFDAPVRTHSLGQRMRCELAACLLHEPRILFLDEPSIGLDLLAKQRFREMVVRLNEDQRTTILLTSHDVADIEYVAHRVMVINHGRLIYDDSVDRMRREYFATKMIEIGLTHPVEAFEAPGTTVDYQSDLSIRLVVDTQTHPVRDVVDGLLDRLPVADLSIIDPPLEDVIASIYRARSS